MKRIDKYTRAARSFYNLNRWICIRMDAIGGLFSSGLATYLVYGPHTLDAAKTGFSLVMAVAFSSMVTESSSPRLQCLTPASRSCGSSEC